MNHSKSSLFLMELIIAILFFSMASAVCIQLFAKAHIISLDTVNQNNAITHAQNLAESWYATDGDLAEMARLFGYIIADDGQRIVLVYDSNWTFQEPQLDFVEPMYYAELVSYPADEKGLINAKISVYTFSDNEPETIYSLDLVQHVAKRRGNIE